MRVHLIHADEELQDLDSSSKLNAEWTFLTRLHERGRAWAHRTGSRRTMTGSGCAPPSISTRLFADSLRPVNGA
jgi:NTE family protein